MHAVEIADLKKSYARGPEALKGVSFTIKEGEVFGLLGPNGAGKTTLINILAGVVQKTSGAAKVFNKDIDEDATFVKKSLGVVPQEVSFNPFFTVEQAIKFQFGYYGQSIDQDWIDYLLDRLSLTDKRKTKPRLLSGGMKRRFMIARALAHKPKVVVLDEPTAGVDVELRRQLYRFVEELNEQGTTVILTTHYLEEAERLCDRVAIMNEGTLLACEPIAELKKRYDGLAPDGETPKLEDIFVHVTNLKV